MNAPFEVTEARAKLYRRAMPSAASVAYVRQNGLGLRSLGDPDPIAEHAGLLTVLQVSVLPGNRWDFLDGIAAPVCALGRVSNLMRQRLPLGLSRLVRRGDELPA